MPFIRHLRYDSSFKIEAGTVTEVEFIKHKRSQHKRGHKYCMLMLPNGDMADSIQVGIFGGGLFWEVLSPLEELAMVLE